MHRIQGVDGTMVHAPPWNGQDTGEASPSRDSVIAVRPESRDGRPEDRRRRELGVSGAAGIPAEGHAGTERQADTRSPATAIGSAEAAAREAVDSGAAARRPPDRAVDVAPGRCADSARVWGAVSPRPWLESANGPGVELPEARAARLERDEPAIARWTRTEWPRIK